MSKINYFLKIDRLIKVLCQFTIPTLFLLVIPLKGSDYIWPTNASQLLTSSFCEFRPRHYHAAIDIKTWNRTGYRVFAIEDGYVMRVRVSAFGYGKAIYLKLKDGNIVVYAHLQNFFPALEDYVNQMRLKNKNYRVDIHLTSDKFPVSKGQRIGYSGRTGIGYPHLHFEIRDAENHPINPLQFYPNTIRDTIKPQLYEIAFIPFDHQSLINFTNDTLFYNLDQRNSVYLEDTLLFTGKIGLVLKSYDQAEGATNSYSFYKANMWIDDSLVYTAKYDRFSYSTTKQVEIDKNFSLWRKNRGIYHNFYLHEANQLQHYQNFPANSGILDSNILTEGIHHLKIEISDFWQNTAQFNMDFIITHPVFLDYDLNRWLEDDLFVRIQSPQPLREIQVNTKGNTDRWYSLPLKQNFDSFKNREFFHYTFTVSPALEDRKKPIKIYGITTSGIPTFPIFILPSTRNESDISSNGIKILESQAKQYWFEIIIQSEHKKFQFALEELTRQIENIFWYPIDEITYKLHIPYPSYFLNSEIFEKYFGERFQEHVFIERKKSNTIYSSDSLFYAFFPQYALYDQTVVYVSIYDTVMMDKDEVQHIGKIYDLQPFDQAVDNAIWITMQIHDEITNSKGLSLYYWDSKKGWIYMPSTFEPTTYSLSTKVTSMEKFAIIQDTIPPVVIPMQHEHNGQLVRDNGILMFVIKDELSGIGNESQIEVFLNDRWQLFNFDPEEDYISINIPDSTDTEYHLKLRAQDNVGNFTEKSYLVK